MLAASLFLPSARWKTRVVVCHCASHGTGYSCGDISVLPLSQLFCFLLFSGAVAVCILCGPVACLRGLMCALSRQLSSAWWRAEEKQRELADEDRIAAVTRRQGRCFLRITHPFFFFHWLCVFTSLQNENNGRCLCFLEAVQERVLLCFFIWLYIRMYFFFF